MSKILFCFIQCGIMASLSCDVNEVMKASGESTLEKATQKAQEQIDNFFNVSLNIAVTGESGVGKSTFVNAIRGLKDEEEGAAETGLTETTSISAAYPHPKMPNVKYWDLPGIGTPNFKVTTYAKDVELDNYDFFFIISERFKENDIKLAKEIRRRKKPFYFVRSKIDQVIQAESKKRNSDKEKTLSKIRENCQKNLKDMGDPKVFLISSASTHEYDFQDLVDTLMSELPEHKRAALLQSLPVGSMAILDKKVKIFKVVIWAAAALSGVVAVAPVPGLSAACDATILLTFFMTCYYSFGLDDKSIQEMSERVNKPELKDLRRSPLVCSLVRTSKERLQQSPLGNKKAVENLRSLVSTDNVAAVHKSFDLTCRILNKGLEDIANTSREILRAAGLE